MVRLKRALALAAVAALIVIFFTFDLGRFLSLEYVKAQQASFAVFYEQNMVLTLAVYLAIYVMTTALSLPGATILTLLAGGLFGLGIGTVVVSFASSLGATCAFVIARYLLRDGMQKRFGDKLRLINEGIAREGAFFLFSLRLIPLFPFFLINVVMGLTPMRVATFYGVSQLGMLPGTIAYVNAGTQLATLQSVAGIVSPRIILSFALLGIFPLLARRVVDGQRARRIYARWRRPKKFDYNVVVIGAGSAGLVTSYVAAAVKAKVALVERHRMGGDCLNTGCVPSKALIKTARLLAQARRSKDFGVRSMTVDFEFAEIMERVQRVIKDIEPHDSVARYTSLGVDCLTGEARLVSPWEVEVNGRRLSTRNVVVATGASPIIPSLPGILEAPHCTSDTLWDLRQLPKNLCVLGGGPIGCELAQCFGRLGSKVAIVEMAPALLPKEDDDVGAAVAKTFLAEGIEVLTGFSAERVEKKNGGFQLNCRGENGERAVPFDMLLVALGRRANVTGFGLEELGVKIAKGGTIESDPWLRTNIPNLFVCGDVAGPYQFTHAASHQAGYASINALFGNGLWSGFTADYRVMPWVTFVDPEVARVGLSEREAREKGLAYELTTYGIDDLDRAIAESEAHGFVKVLTVPGKDTILGATVVGPHAGDYFIEFVAAMKHKRGLKSVMGTIHPYPTFAEANRYVAGAWRRQHTSQKTLAYLAKFHAWRRG